MAEEFLEKTAAQLTYHGLSELSYHTKELEMCVFFRNNHFSTLYKNKVSFHVSSCSNSHNYLFVNSDKFDKLHEVWHSTSVVVHGKIVVMDNHLI